jgi:hypothetical protein
LFRQAAATGFDLSAKFFRVFLVETDFLGLNIHKLRHIITPTLGYTYQAKPTHSSDRVRSGGLGKGNAMTFGIENKLQTKRPEGDGFRTDELLRFLTSVPYDLEGTSGRGGRVGSVGLDFESDPYPWLSMEWDAGIDPHIGKMTGFNADLVFHEETRKELLLDKKEEETKRRAIDLTEGVEQRPWLLGLGWRYQRNTSSQLTLGAEFNLGKKWRVELFQAFDVKRFITETSDRGSRTVKKIYDIPEYEYRIERDLHEWTVELVYNVRRQMGESILLLFHLKAFPEMPLEYEKQYHFPKAGKNFPKAGEVRK